MAETAKVKIRAVAPIHPSEDPTKVEDAVRNVFDGRLVIQRYMVASDADDISSLNMVRDAIRTGAESRNAYRRNLLENLKDDTTWFYLNKQAAFAGRVAICQQADESPLGPIKVTIISAYPERTIDWLLAQANMPA